MSNQTGKGPDAVGRMLYPGNSNRWILSVLSGLPSEGDWALRDLVRLSAQATDRFNLANWPLALDAFLLWPLKLLELAQESSRWGDAGWELRGEEGMETERRATESLLILRNVGLNEKLNGQVLGRSSRLAEYLEAFFHLPPELLLDHLSEPALLALDIFEHLVASPAFTLRAGSPIPLALAPLLRSKDRAILQSVLRLTTFLTSPASKPAAIASAQPLVAPALETAIMLLLLPKTPDELVLRTAALDLLYQQTTDPTQAARAVLARTDVGPVVRLLTNGLYDDAKRLEQPFSLLPRDSIGIVDVRLRPLQPGLFNPEDFLPSTEELDALTLMPEPDRCKRWIKRMYRSTETGKVTQTAFWGAYRMAFTERVGALAGTVAPMMSASEVIKLVSEIMEGASASVDPHPTDPSAKVFLIKGIEERLPFPTEPLPNPLLNATYPILRTSLAPTTQQPEGNALTSALILRNLARAVIELLDLSADGNDDDDDGGDGGEGTQSGGGGKRGAGERGDRGSRRKKAKLANGELFGLPIPESLQYAGQGQGAQAAAAAAADAEDGEGATDVRLRPEELARVRNAFGGVVEERVLEWVTGEDKLAAYLTEVLECISLLGGLP